MSSHRAGATAELGRPYRCKRVLDLVIAGAACLVFAPFVTVIAFMVWFEDRDVPWFLQTRVGRERQPFVILKLRTMRDHNVTCVGRWLRRTGLDELPQFYNVLRGDMSIVGPRPLTQLDIDRLCWDGRSHDWRFAVKPGITGLSQLFAGVASRASRRLDRLYLRRQSIGVDLKLIGMSFGVNIFGKHAIRRWLRGSE